MIDDNRRFPMRVEFLSDKKMNDIIYGFLLSNSFPTEDNRRYCNKADVTAGKMIKYFKEQHLDSPISERTIRDLFKLFINIDLLEEGQLDKQRVYFLPYLDGTEGKVYVKIKTDTLQFLVDTANNNVIKVYAHLKMMMEIHKSKKYKELFRFSKASLLDVIGYKTQNYYRNYEMIENILDSLQNNGLIKFHKDFIRTESGQVTEYYFLDEVNDNYIKHNSQKIRDYGECAVLVEKPADGFIF